MARAATAGESPCPGPSIVRVRQPCALSGSITVDHSSTLPVHPWVRTQAGPERGPVRRYATSIPVALMKGMAAPSGRRTGAVARLLVHQAQGATGYLTVRVIHNTP